MNGMAYIKNASLVS